MRVCVVSDMKYETRTIFLAHCISQVRPLVVDSDSLSQKPLKEGFRLTASALPLPTSRFLLPVTMAEMDQDRAKKLFHFGATFLFLDVPEGTEFGMDCNVWTVGPKFKGVKMIPPGLHFIHFRWALAF